MATLTLAEKKLLNNMTPGAKKVKLGDKLGASIAPAAAVPNAAGSAPTAAEFNALLASLRAKGVIAT